MYRRPKFLEILHEIREEMSREADFDIESFAEIARTGEVKNQRSKIKISEAFSFPNLEYSTTEDQRPKTNK